MSEDTKLIHPKKAKQQYMKIKKVALCANFQSLKYFPPYCWEEIVYSYNVKDNEELIEEKTEIVKNHKKGIFSNVLEDLSTKKKHTPYFPKMVSVSVM